MLGVIDHGGAAIPTLADWLGVALKAEDSQTSVEQTNAQESGEFPKWSEWPDTMRSQFRDIAGETSRRLGYTQFVD